MSHSFTLDEYFALWCEEAAVRNKPQTVDRYRFAYSHHIAPALGSERLDAIGRFELKRLMLDRVREGAGPGTLFAMAKVLSMLFSSAYDEGLIDRHPAMRLRKLFARQATETAPKAMSEAELSRFLRAVALDPPYRGLFRTIALTGLRHGEARALQVGDVRPETLRIHVERTFSGKLKTISESPKTSSSRRRVEMPRELAAELALERWRPPREWLFLSKRGKREPIGYFASRDAFRRALRRAKLPSRFTPHSLRHTYASLLIQRGVPIEYVKRQLGHSSIQVTVDVYGRWLDSSHSDELDKLADSVAEDIPYALSIPGAFPRSSSSELDDTEDDPPHEEPA